MKRPVFALLATTALAGLIALSGNALVARGLNAVLPGLLENALGMPVRLAPLTVNLLRLQASSPEVLIGEADAPVVHAEQVVVRLELDALLSARLRFLSVTANSLALALWRWPDTETSASENYLWVREWLPGEARVHSLRLISERDDDLTAGSVYWHIGEDGGANLQALVASGPRELALRARFASLHAMLALEPVAFALHAAPADSPGSGVDVQGQLQPQAGGGYALDVAVAADGLQADVQARSGASWQAPTHSEIDISTLQLDILLAEVSRYRPQGERTSLDALLDAEVPALALPEHAATLRIAELRRGTVALADTGFTLQTHANGFGLNDFTSRTKATVLQGALQVTDDTTGWRIELEAGVSADNSPARSLEEPENHDDNAPGLIAANTGDDWHLATGSAHLAASGNTWGELLYSLTGKVHASGAYDASETVPVELRATLDNRPGEFVLEDLLVAFDDVTVSGSGSITGNERRRISLHLKSDRLDLSQFQAAGAATTQAAQTDPTKSTGIAPAEYLAPLAGMDVDASAEITQLRGVGLALDDVKAILAHGASDTSLDIHARDPSEGEYHLALRASQQDSNAPAFKLSTALSNANLPALLRAPGMPHSRASGTLTFSSPASTGSQLLEQMAVQADISLDLRADNNWQRPASDDEMFQVTADARLIVKQEYIQGVNVERIGVHGNDQDLAGSARVQVGQPHWLTATLTSQRIDIDHLLALLPEDTEQGNDEPLLQTLKKLENIQLKYAAEQLVIRATPLKNLELDLTSGPDSVHLNKFDFKLFDGNFASQGNILWRGSKTALKASATLEKLNLNHFLVEAKGQAGIPVSGRVALSSEGETTSELFANLAGDVALAVSDGAESSGADTRPRLEATVKRLPNGMQLSVSTLKWGDTELAGRLSYFPDGPGGPDPDGKKQAQLVIDIDRGSLSLLPWEAPANGAGKQGKNRTGTALVDAAAAGAGFVGKFILSPLTLLAGDREARPGERIFSDEPLAFEQLGAIDVAVRGKLDSVKSTVLEAGDITFDVTVKDKALAATISSNALNRGIGELTLAYSTGTQPPELHLESTFTGIHGLSGEANSPGTGLLTFSSVGSSPAELAANSNGLFYIELGKGPLDYSGTVFLNADVATAVFRTLLPGMENAPPELECGVALLQAQNGIAATPYGLVARTSQANLVGRAQIDLKKETLRITLDSRSRQGVGLSVGSIFANTVEVRGPLSAPEIEPNTAGILLRGWAAVMTAGLSIVGESVLKRALASENPCVEIKQLIREDFCSVNDTAAASPLVCPAQAERP